MAIPRVQPTAPTALKCRRLSDFPPFTEAESRLSDLQSQLSILDADFMKLDHIPTNQRPDPFEAGALALLSDGGALVETVPDIAGLQREIAKHHRAIEIQASEVERQRGIAARQIAKDLADDHRRLIATFIDHQQRADAAYDALMTFRRAATAMCGVECVPPYAVNDPKRQVYFTNFREFVAFTADYLKGASNG